MQFASYEPLSNGESGADEVGVTANKPKSPKPKRGCAAAKPDELSE
jgi:hypothetical protein